MLADLQLPPGCRVQIEYDPDVWPTNVTITVFRDGAWLGEISANAGRIDRAGELQRCVDHVTKRGVREVLELPKEGEKVSAAMFAQLWRIVKCIGGPLDGQVVSIKSDEMSWSGYASIRTAKGETFRDPPPGGTYHLDQGGTSVTWVPESE